MNETKRGREVQKSVGEPTSTVREKEKQNLFDERFEINNANPRASTEKVSQRLNSRQAVVLGSTEEEEDSAWNAIITFYCVNTGKVLEKSEIPIQFSPLL